MYRLTTALRNPVAWGLLFGVAHLGFWWLYSLTPQGQSFHTVSQQTFIVNAVILACSIWFICDTDTEIRWKDSLLNAWRYLAGIGIGNIPVLLAYLAGC